MTGNTIDEGCTRREALKKLAVGGAVLALPPLFHADAQATTANAPLLTLPPLPFALDALEPHVDATTMEIHHGKHHAAYVKNLAAALEGHTAIAGRSLRELVSNLDDVPASIRPIVRNNAGGHANHMLFWSILSPHPVQAPSGTLADAIEHQWGSLDELKGAIQKAALSVFGSGWAWLSRNPDGSLLVESTPNQDSPLMSGREPILGIDVWEHAYYLKHQNRRADYLKSIWNVLDWQAVARLYQAG